MAKRKAKATETAAAKEHKEHKDNPQVGRPADVKLVGIGQIRIAAAAGGRTQTDAEKMAELTASVKRQGILQPLVVRPFDGLSAGEPDAEYELVCGHRRMEAAISAGLTIVPVLVRVVRDDELAEVQLMENIHRADMDPLDEGAMFCQLLTMRNHTVAEVALRVGKSAGYVGLRARLAELPDVARDAMREDLIGLGIAQVILRVRDEKARKKFAKDVCDAARNGYAYSVKSAAARAEQLYMKTLDGTRFETDREYGDLSTCADCPSRSHNAQDLFPTASEDDLCMDGKCYGHKCDLEIERQSAIARGQGKRVLSPEEQKQLFSGGTGGTWLMDDRFMDMDVPMWQDKDGKSLRKLLGKMPKKLAAPVLDSVAVAWDGAGKKRELADATIARKALVDAGHEWAAPKQENAAYMGRDWELEAKISNAVQNAMRAWARECENPTLLARVSVLAESDQLDDDLPDPEESDDGTGVDEGDTVDGVDEGEPGRASGSSGALAMIEGDLPELMRRICARSIDRIYEWPTDEAEMSPMRTALLELTGVDLAAIRERVKMELEDAAAAAKDAEKEEEAE